MRLNNLEKVIETSKKRVGRGLGSGKGKTGGRGQKGQKARGKVAASFIGGSLPLYKKLPFKRGWGNAKAGIKPIVLSLSSLNVFKAKSKVGLESLIERGLVSEKEAKKKGVKILNKGELKVALEINLPVSIAVKEIVEKKGGKVVQSS